ncbi:carbohydrate binding domain cbm49 protein [Acanthamoeba castellanii str. Neff]|uniref:Carbohydrate binding domain cbm49 protein n=1 Tax=Acanthamoeba castellanii (strain ATCC 30010 / Neff) TaxID=1257118 RepID=L8GK98_ACACF|nr:carbohydrate binding domain cbm49 protein [Acanthamoeba castellanii str. Neff]ELR13462.1 carbohydrate binding domain cbm49 protein [Acanthamoeba castellanii str. Neff]
MKQQHQLVLLVFAALFCLTAADCAVRIEQSLGSAWNGAGGVPMSQWNARIVSSGSETVTALQVAFGAPTTAIDQVWGLEPVAGASRVYDLPDYVILNGGLASGQAFNWGYIWESSAQAPLSVASVQCSGGASPTAAPSASSSPVTAPSASSSPVTAPSASPTIVASPAPCQLSVSQTTRPSSAGGSWTEGDFFFQIYDLTLLNSGSRPVSSAVIAIDTTSNQQQVITQFWNLERQSATSDLFNVRNPGGNIEVGATLGAGYIVRTPLSAGSQVPPTTRLVSVNCVGGPSPTIVATPQPSASPTIVASPQPSASPAAGCNAAVSIVARSAAAGGSWTTGPNQFFQIFDITITNTGQRPLNGGVLTFGLPVAGSTITQWWELNRQGNTNVFNVAFNFGPLLVGASQGAGIVVQTSSPSQALPSAVLSNLACAA